MNNCDTVEVIKVLLEEIKAQNNDILDYTDFSKKQHSELLVIVNVKNFSLYLNFPLEKLKYCKNSIKRAKKIYRNN